MNKRVYILVGAFFFLLLASNILNDKYYFNYKNQDLTVMNASKTSRSQATIYGDGSNQGDFIQTPQVDLPKGNYLVKVKYKADTDLNYITVSGQSIGEEINISNGDNPLVSSEKEISYPITLDKDVYDFMVHVYFGGEGTFVFQEMTVESASITNTDTIAWLIIFIIVWSSIGFMLYSKESKEKNQKLLVFLSLLGITILVSYPLFTNHLITGDDSMFHLTRIEGIKNGLLAGQFPVRLHTSTYYGYGYATSVFYPELFLYFPALLRILGVSTTGTVQIFLIFIQFFTAASMYFAAYRISRVRSIGILSSIIYVFSTYHIVDVYSRFALGESLAMIFIPLLIYGVYELMCGDETRWKYVVLGATGILQSHIITTIVAIAFVGLTAILCFRSLMERKRILSCVKAFTMTLLLNLWFLTPFISMIKQDMNVSSMAKNVSELALSVDKLFHNFITTGELRSMEIGFPIVLGVMLFVYILVQGKIEDQVQERVILTLLVFGIFSAFVTTNLFPWRLIESMPLIGNAAKMIQFPWRLLTFASAFLSIVAAYGIFYMVTNSEARKSILVAVFAISALLASRDLDEISKRENYCYKGAIVDNSGVGSGEYYYNGTKYTKLQTRGEVVTTSSDEMKVDSFERMNGKFKIVVANNSTEEQFVEIPLAYYPFYEAKLDDKEKLMIDKGENNVVKIIVPENSKGTISIGYVKNLIWGISDGISALSLLFFIYILAKKGKKISLLDKKIFLC